MRTPEKAQGAIEEAGRRPSIAERLLAAAAHLLALASLPGIVVTALIWLLAHEGTPYLRFQARQALRWQVLANLIVAGLIGLALAVIVGAGFGGGGARAGGALDVAFAMGLAIAGILALSSVIFGLPAIIGALIALFGGDFRYPIVTRHRRGGAAPGAAKR